MTNIRIQLPNGDIREFSKGSTGEDIAKSIGKKLAQDALGIKVNGKPQDLGLPILSDCEIQILTFDSNEGKDMYWHSSSHWMAQAIEELYPGTKFGAGPAVENGFYYDIDSKHSFTEKDLRAIEERMVEISKRDLAIHREELSKYDAITYFTTKRNDPFKIEILTDTIKDDAVVSIYHQGEFSDLCTGPHVSKTSKLKSVRLTGVSSSYWRGDEKRKKMQRIYGISFPSNKELEEYFNRIEEAKRRDHRKLGVELDLFTFSPLVGKGLPIWLPKGTIVRTQLETFLKEEQLKRGYQQVITPHVGNIELYKTSGHYPYYKDSQFPPITFADENEETESYILKPMNCPHHHQVYSSKSRSYKELPIRIAEFGTVYRYEQSGELNGLLRARSFTQDDAHIYCRMDQLEQEICDTVELTLLVFQAVGFKDVEVRLSFRDKTNKEKYGGSDEEWERAENDIRRVANKMNLKYFVGIGEASFYGPKIDFIIRDAIGRKWQLGTVQVDYVMPHRFELSFTNSSNTEERPVIIHRAPFGSMERMTAIIIENFMGNFPLWLAPVQVAILPITEHDVEFAKQLESTLLSHQLRATLDARNEKISKKIRDAETQKIPYMAIVGEKERTENKIAIRKHKEGDKGKSTVEEFISMLQNEIKLKHQT